MSGIVLSASVRQNLLSLQSTAALLATTQNDLATGNKVNTALDNPTNFFTAQGLNNRASDISSLLDSIGNGVQVLQAANTGLTSLEQLVQSAQSVATQALQTTVGYSSKSSFTVNLGTGATAANLLGGSTFTNNTFTGLTAQNTLATPADVTAATSLTAAATSNAISATIANGDTITVDGHLITFATGAPPTTATVAPDSGVLATPHTNVTTDGAGDSTIYLNGGGANGASISDLLEAVDLATGSQTASISGGAATVTTPTGETASSVNGTGQLLIQTGTTSDLTISSSNTSLLASLGIGNGSATTSLARTPASGSSLGTNTILDIGAVGNGTATSITFGTGTGQISNLNDLNTALAANNLQATLDANGNLTIVTDNDNASATIGALTGSNHIFAGRSASAPVADPAAQATRAGLISQYNNILSQITTTAQDSSFNGINLLNGDTLKLVFNETGTSTLSINGANFNAAGLGLSNLVVGTDFIDNAATNKVLTSLQGASDLLRSEASNLGSNLSVVQIRQDFNKNLINVLQTGASNLTLADPNEEAANSQALSTRQSIAVSALALANQSQQSVLQLLR
jgi:flagellin